VVAGHGAAGDQRVRAALERLGHQEAELAHLVAREVGARQVVALDPELEAEVAPEALQALERGGQARQRQMDGGQEVHAAREPTAARSP
jgi:hypothetical protein